MKIFITGGGGFIGSSLILYLKNHDIVCFGHGTNFTELKNIVGKNVRFVEGELIDKVLINTEMIGVDVVIHLAGVVGNVACMKDPLKATLSHTIGTQILLDAAKNNSVKKFIFTSTQSVYTTYTQRTIPFTEDMELEPDDFYGALKTSAECDVLNSGINYVILRLSNIYGYGSGLYIKKDSGAMGRFVRAGLEGTEITINGAGDQGIDYLHISDTCRAVLEIIERDDINHEIFNVGSGKLFKIRDLAETVVKLSKEINNKDVTIKKVPAPEGSIWPDRLMSIEKIKKKIGWEPQVTPEEALKEIYVKLK